MIRVVLPFHLQRLADCEREVQLKVEGPVSTGAILDALEEKFPVLRGAIREHTTRERRAYIRFFACGEDFSHQSQDTPLPSEVVKGEEPLRIVGALAGG